MNKDIFIGIDGGATKTKARIEDAEGQLLSQGLAGPANIALSVEKAWQSIHAAIDEALGLVNLNLQTPHHYFHVGMGLAGCEVKSAYETFLRQPHSFANLALFSDAHAACAGAHLGKNGSIIIIGTGVVGYQIEGHHNSKVSGWGFPHDDIGSGAWLGLEAIRLTFQWLDQRTEKSPLVEDIFDFFNKDIQQMVAWANEANSTEFARLAPLVINHAQQEEIAAVRLLKKAAHAIDKVSYALQKKQLDPTPPLPCSLFGGIAPFIEPWLSEDVRQQIVPRRADAAVGAILMIKEHLQQRVSA